MPHLLGGMDYLSKGEIAHWQGFKQISEQYLREMDLLCI